MKLKTVSATSYNLYQECPNCWRLKYKMGLIQPDSDALIIGKGFHKGVELFHNGKSVDELFTELQKDLLINKDDQSIKNFGLVRKMVECYIKNPIKDENVETEWNFRIPLKVCKAPLFGYIDRVTKKGIVEYKTTSIDYTEKDIEDNIQYDIYSYAFDNKFGGLPEITTYVINKTKIKKPDYKPQIIKHKRTYKDLLDLESKLEVFYDNVENERFVATPKNHKFWSYYKKYCK